MKKIYTSSTFILLVALMPFAGFSQQTINGTMTHDGIEREYILYVPEIYDDQSPAPLVFNFHGYSSNAGEQVLYGDFRSIADTAGFLVVHPEGTLDDYGITHFNVGWGASTVDDVGFTDALIDEIASTYSIDETRVYSTGMSNGGFMSYYLACQLSDRIAAIASVTGSMSPLQTSTCDPQGTVPVLEIHGTSDQVVPYNGAGFSEPTEDVVAYWYQHNNCNILPTIVQIPDTNTGDGSTVEHFIYGDCSDEVTTELFKITGGQHTWPGTAIGFPGTNYDIDASAEIWKFFSRYDINGKIIFSDVSEIETQSIFVYPNPVLSELTIEADQNIESEFELISLSGKTILNGQMSGQFQQVEMSDLPAGIYFLRINGAVFKLFK